MKTRSLTRQAVVSVLLMEMLCVIAFSGTALLHERRTRFRAFDVTLRGRSDSLLGAIQDAEDPDDDVTIDPTELSLPGQDVWAVYNQGGRLLGTSKGAPAALIRRAADGFGDRRADGHVYRVYQREGLRVIDRAEYGGNGLRRPVTILYSERTDAIWHEVLEAAGFYAAASLLLMLVTGFLMILLLRRVLQPIRELATEASGVSASSLRFQPPAAALRLRELRPLAEALSGTIGSLQQAIEKEHRFVGDAAHELKTAVAVVRSTLQVLMMRRRSQEEYAEGMERLFEDNHRVEELVARMLTLAHLEESTGTEGGSADLVETVQRTMDKLGSFAEAREVALVAQVGPKLCVPLSSEKAEIVLSNLVVNAVQHSSRGGQVQVSVEESQGAAVMQVRDGGAGISAEAIPHVFERFFREDTSRSRQTGGAGLGLAICKSIVDSAGGVICVESTRGQGTVVTVTFSLA